MRKGLFLLTLIPVGTVAGLIIQAYLIYLVPAVLLALLAYRFLTDSWVRVEKRHDPEFRWTWRAYEFWTLWAEHER